MICKNNECRAELPDDAVFCHKCGTKQEVSEPIETQNEIAEDTINYATTNKSTKKYIPLIVAIILIIGIIFIFAIVVESAPRVPSPSDVTTQDIDTLPIENRENSMEWCPVKIVNVAVGEDEQLNKIKVTANWKYTFNSSTGSMIADKIFFCFTVYNEDGKECYHSPSTFTTEGPFEKGTSYENSWLTYESFSSADIKSITVFYHNAEMTKRVKIVYEKQPETQPITNNQNNYWSELKALDECPIKVTSCYPSAPNSADGVDLHINWYSEDTKEIKYIYFYVTPYNRVNDKQTCEIRDYSTHGCYVTGPFSYGASDYSYWDCIWYNSDIDHVELDKIVIQYMDGTSEYYY